MKIKNKTTGQWEPFYMAGYAAMPEYDATVTETSANAPTSAAVKNYVDGRTIPYIDNGYYKIPTEWTIVGDMPADPNPSTLYFVCPDWVVKDNFIVNLDGSVDTSIITFESVSCIMQNPNDNTQQQSFDITFPTSYDTSLKKVPQYGCNVGLIPYYTKNSSSQQSISMSAYLEGRDSNTYLQDYAFLNESNIINGATYYLQAEEIYPPLRYLGGDELHYKLNITIDGGGDSGGMACLTEDTLIKTIAGDKEIKDIKVGDAVIDEKNIAVLVTKIYTHDINTLYKIILNNGDSFIASGSHKIKTTVGTVPCFCLVKDLQVKRSDGSTFTVTSHDRIKMKNPIKVYEIQTETGTYLLANGVINESEDI